MDEEYLTVAEVAALLKLNQQTVRNWIDASSLPAVRVGRRVRIKRSDVEAMVDRGYTAKPAVEPDAEARRRLGAASAAVTAAASESDAVLTAALVELSDAALALADVLTARYATPRATQTS